MINHLTDAKYLPYFVRWLLLTFAVVLTVVLAVAIIGAVAAVVIALFGGAAGVCILLTFSIAGFIAQSILEEQS